MDVRWLPLLAAALGVLGGVLGALAGGCIANKGQESRFERERQAQIQDMRTEVYADFVGAADQLAIRLFAETATPSDAGTNIACEPDATDEGALEDQIPEDQWAAYQQVLADKARVILFGGRREVGDAAFAATQTLEIWMAALAALDGGRALACSDAYPDAIDHFYLLAREETQPPVSNGG
jgi:hypothetical protein